MKKIFIFMIIVVLLAACGNEEKLEATKTQKEPSAVEQNEMSLEKGLKADTEEQNYLSLSQDEVPVNSKMKFTDVVVSSDEGLFKLKSKAGTSANEVV
ncbi:ferrichrome ABC superfamily ATP binding cassette transporter lipoprotein [Sporosarcina newyorkensis 2681]|uniref:Ferrichrome ABC superfamily ATP binding cassette transporter lipoprotein n=1 Tax=Sporosarcina newyorkensis 2681 TaxID=1027292 RepID=F9DSE5_9BACL|nr:hypothetical protein [Sporosarcina newyorkensis]EGQ26282.1 ferrichrome ABC superfamily ATP binding cassette transporter lipoprotein [Sporosarcina newyorkensis 2681]